MTPPDFSTRRAARGSRRGEPLLFALCLALFVGAAYEAWGARREQDAAAAAHTQLASELQEARGRATKLERRSRDGVDALAVQAQLSRQAGPVRVLAELTRLLPDDTRLESVSFSYGTRLDVDVTVVARNPAAYDLLVARLQDAPRFATVLPGSELREGEMRASLHLTWSERAP
jgi:Tfp pilus assembly protein PilN